MRIVHVVEAFAGGTFDFIVSAVRGLPEYEHIIVHGMRDNTPPDYQSMFPAGTKFCLWPHIQREIHVKQDFMAFIALQKILKQLQNISVLHLHSSKAGFLGRLAARYLGLSGRVLYTSHGASFLRTDISMPKKTLYVALEKLASWCGGMTVACSESEAAVFRSYHIENVLAILNGVEINDKSHRCLGPAKTKFVVGTVGRICTQKNPELFNEIAQAFLPQSEIQFLWIGDGELRSKLTAGNISVSGWIKQSAVMDYLAQIDVYLSTALWEGLSLGVLQAMAAGKPLVLSNCVGNRDLVIEGENGYTFNDSNKAVYAVDALFYNRNACKMYGEVSYNMADELFSMKRMLTAYDKVYRTIFDKMN